MHLSPFFVSRWKESLGLTNCKYPVDKPFEDLQAEDLTLCGFGFGHSLFDFQIKLPKVDAVCLVTATTLSGKTFTTNISYQQNVTIKNK